MNDEPAEPRTGRGQILLALGREDLELYSAEELSERIASLRVEISRIEAQMAKKANVRSSADALFSFKILLVPARVIKAKSPNGDKATPGHKMWLHGAGRENFA